MACPANGYKANQGGTRRIQERSRKVTRTYKYRQAKTLRRNKYKAYYASLQDRNNNSKWKNCLVRRTFLIIIGISI